MSFVCETCGQEHRGLPTDIAFRKPLHYFLVPEDEREARIRSNDDLCIIDDEIFLIRGVLIVPILGEESDFAWGAWAQISRANYERCLELWDEDGFAEPPFKGTLSFSPNGYEDALDKGVYVQLRGATSRPLFTASADAGRIYEEQNSGIDHHRWNEIIEQCEPHLIS